jgi:DNA-binding response OmpR family regulator
MTYGIVVYIALPEEYTKWEAEAAANRVRNATLRTVPRGTAAMHTIQVRPTLEPLHSIKHASAQLVRNHGNLPDQGLHIDVMNSVVLYNQTPIDLPQRCIDLLTHLARNQGQVLTVERLLEDLYDGTANATAIRTAVHRLRVGLTPHGIDVNALRSRGYQFPDDVPVTITGPPPARHADNRTNTPHVTAGTVTL